MEQRGKSPRPDSDTLSVAENPQAERASKGQAPYQSPFRRRLTAYERGGEK
ncbi:MAG TPA: hypothetical protein VKU02_19280 [Gemmataceae bacterium]|nr:hypothetical protein [Gemmataceae bacterium]